MAHELTPEEVEALAPIVLQLARYRCHLLSDVQVLCVGTQDEWHCQRIADLSKEALEVVKKADYLNCLLNKVRDDE